jgi:GNAT superfamily N-acetyltransferase
VLHIKRLSDLDIHTQALCALKEIFFLTSSRTIFASEKAKEEFFANWTKYYLEMQPEHVYLAFAENSRLLGYLTGCPDSQTASKFIRLPSLELFNDHFRKYPAHFHINAHPSAQGQGIGSKLVTKFVEDLIAVGACGVHIVTSPTAPNVAFYKRNGFDFSEERLLNGTPVLFMGRTL